MRRVVAAVVGALVVACVSYSADPEAPPADGGAGGACTTTCPANACGTVRLPCGVVECGTCTGALEKCVDGQCKCLPKTCKEVGAQCGAVADGCGGQIYCGECGGAAPVDAGADARAGDAGDAGAVAALRCGAENVCTTAPCVPKKPSEACFDPKVRLCGQHSDGCGGVVDCGTSACSGVGESCGGGGKAGQCGCKPLPSCYGNCYSSCSDGCGGTRKCNCNNCK